MVVEEQAAPVPATREEARRELEALAPGETYSRATPFTVEEFFELVDEDSPFELLEGVILMPTPPTDPHESLFGWLFTLLFAYVDARRLGQVRGSRTGVRIGGRSFRVPDLLFVRAEHAERIERVGMSGAPDLVVEIVDSGKARREAVVKQAQYERLGVPELWVIDLPWKEFRHFTLEEGVYRRLPVAPEGEVAALQVPGFRLKVAWLFEEPRSVSSLDVLRELLKHV